MERLDRALEIMEQLLHQVGEARAEVLILRSLCGLLLGEAVRSDPDPKGRLDTLAAMLREAAEAATDTTPTSPIDEDVRLAQVRAVEGVIRIAEAQFGRNEISN